MRIFGIVRSLQRLYIETTGQDLIEYALVAGFVAVAAGAIFPAGLMPSVSTVFSKINSCFAAASNGS
jgi:Flp pilus assembly pilin Flp